MALKEKDGFKITPSEEELSEILTRHYLFLINKQSGKLPDFYQGNLTPKQAPSLMGCDFSEFTIYEDMIEIELDYCDFEFADVEGVRFYGSSLFKANFERADITGADFKYTNIYKANFKGAIMDSETRFDDSDFYAFRDCAYVDYSGNRKILLFKHTKRYKKLKNKALIIKLLSKRIKNETPTITVNPVNFDGPSQTGAKVEP